MRAFALMLLILLPTLLIGCSGENATSSSKPEITQEKFDKLSVGMTPKQVQEIMGGTYPPMIGATESLTFAKDGKTVTVRFKDGKLTDKTSQGL